MVCLTFVAKSGFSARARNLYLLVTVTGEHSFVDQAPSFGGADMIRYGQAAELMFHEMGKPCNQGHAEVMKCAHLVILAKCWWKDQWDGSWIVDHVVGICVMLGWGLITFQENTLSLRIIGPSKLASF